MKPRAIEVHIEELVLHGFDPRARWSVADALQNELRALLGKRGFPKAWKANAAKLDAGAIRLTNAPAAGKQIATAVYRGGAK